MEEKNKIRSYRDLIVYQSSYELCKTVFRKVLPQLPASEKYDLRDQLQRSTKAIPRLIAEGYAKKHQNKGFQKYIDDALAESNETMVGLEQCNDLYNIEPSLCVELVKQYDIISRQLYKLALAWDSFSNSRKAGTIRSSRKEQESNKEGEKLRV